MHCIHCRAYENCTLLKASITHIIYNRCFSLILYCLHLTYSHFTYSRKKNLNLSEYDNIFEKVVCLCFIHFDTQDTFCRVELKKYYLSFGESVSVSLPPGPVQQW